MVKNYDAISRLRGVAQKAKVPIPGMLADSLIQVGAGRPCVLPQGCQGRGHTLHAVGMGDAAALPDTLLCALQPTAEPGPISHCSLLLLLCYS